MCGHFVLALQGVPTFFLGLLLVCLGTGLLKPNISAVVGALYGPTDARRDAGFTLFYIGINLGPRSAASSVVGSPVSTGITDSRPRAWACSRD